MLAETFTLFYSAAIGVYLLAATIFFVCMFYLKIKGSESFLGLSWILCLTLISDILILHGFHYMGGSYGVLPFAGFLWVTGFYVYYRIIIRHFNIRGKFRSFNQVGLKSGMLVLGCLTFFFGIEAFKDIFIAESSANLNMMGYRLTSVGAIVVSLAGTCVFLGNAQLFAYFYKNRAVRKRRLLLWGSFAGVLVTLIDTVTVVGLWDFAPLTLFVYMPGLIYFLMICFSSPYFQLLSIREKVTEGFEIFRRERKGRSTIDEKPERERVYLEGVLKHLLVPLKDRYINYPRDVELNVTKNFYIHGAKSDFVVVFYSLLEKGFEKMAKNSSDGSIRIVCERLDNPVVRMHFSCAPDCLGLENFMVEKGLLAKHEGELKVLDSPGETVLQVSFA